MRITLFICTFILLSAQCCVAAGPALPYTGTVPHIFFHSLIVYPELARADTQRAALFENNMISAAQFKAILIGLYKNNFVLIDSRELYSTDDHGKIHKKNPAVPAGKKPLVLSLDDLNYYQSMVHDGQAQKLVLADGMIKTEVRTPGGTIQVTNDGDVVPIIEQFIQSHPDFSYNGARGIIALTGYDGILGYRTQATSASKVSERIAVMPVITALKKSGWIFASHSYAHDAPFLKGSITEQQLKRDLMRWKNEVEPLVGTTNIFVGPFGQIFTPHDPRRIQLVAAGFNTLYGVGLDEYVKYFHSHVVMDRVNIDGYRLLHNKTFLRDHFAI
jgi:hypothetical protein